jgi:ATP-dependent protease ClpP protease subunit
MATRRSSISDEILGYTHTNNVNVKDRIIYSSSHFEQDDWSMDFRQSLSFIRNLDYLNSLSSDPITIKMFSPGGCYYAGMMMYDAIKNSIAETTVQITGIGASMGSIVPQAATHRLISRYSSFMIHRLSYEDSGDLLRLKSGVVFAEHQLDCMYDIYADRCANGKFFKSKKMNQNAVKDYIRERLEKSSDWWMSAEESVHYGFMDGVL